MWTELEWGMVISVPSAHWATDQAGPTLWSVFCIPTCPFYGDTGWGDLLVKVLWGGRQDGILPLAPWPTLSSFTGMCCCRSHFPQNIERWEQMVVHRHHKTSSLKPVGVVGFVFSGHGVYSTALQNAHVTDNINQSVYDWREIKGTTRTEMSKATFEYNRRKWKALVKQDMIWIGAGPFCVLKIPWVYFVGENTSSFL